MTITGLDGKTYKLDLRGKRVLGEYNRERSSYHRKAKQLITTLFPCDAILEEVYLPGSGRLFCDFLLPLRKLMVEVNGEQHDSYSSFFHKNPLEFLKGKNRDNKKKQFAELNNFRLISLWYDESEEEWKQKLLA